MGNVDQVDQVGIFAIFLHIICRVGRWIDELAMKFNESMGGLNEWLKGMAETARQAAGSCFLSQHHRPKPSVRHGTLPPPPAGAYKAPKAPNRVRSRSGGFLRLCLEEYQNLP